MEMKSHMKSTNNRYMPEISESELPDISRESLRMISIPLGAVCSSWLCSELELKSIVSGHVGMGMSQIQNFEAKCEFKYEIEKTKIKIKTWK